MKDLKDTIDDMLSENYIDRLRAEYQQLYIRILKLNDFIRKYETDQLEHKPETPIETIELQREGMLLYLNALSMRLVYEDVDISIKEVLL